MIITPTNRGQVLAGIGLWAVLWGFILKSDPLFELVGLRFGLKKKILKFTAENKVLTILFTEAVNLLLHGVESAGAAMFVLGGTVFNALMVFVILPVIRLFNKD